MKTYWRRKTFWIAFVASVALPFLIVLYATRPPYKDTGYRDRLLDWSTGELERLYGPSVPEAFVPFGSVDEPSLYLPTELIHLPPAARFSRTSSWAGGAPAVEPEMKWLETYMADYTAAWDQASQEGALWVPMDGRVREQGHFYPNFLRTQNSARAQALFAQQAIHRKDWESALHWAGQTARFSDPVRPAGVIGSLIAVATRSMGYNAHTSLLAEDPPPEVSRRAAENLADLSSTDPWITLPILINEGAIHSAWISQQEVAPRFLNDLQRRNYAVNYALLWIADKAEHVPNERDRRWLVGLRESGQFFPVLPVPWSRQSAASVRAKRIVRQNPDIIAIPGLTEELIDSAPLEERLFTEALFLHSGFRNNDEWQRRSREAATRGRLAQAAFAARVYHAENGHWPESVDDLDPALTAGFERIANPAATPEELLRSRQELADYYGPLSFGWHPVDEDFLELFADRMLDRAGIPTHIDSIPFGWLMEAWDESEKAGAPIARFLSEGYPRRAIITHTWSEGRPDLGAGDPLVVYAMVERIRSLPYVVSAEAWTGRQRLAYHDGRFVRREPGPEPPRELNAENATQWGYSLALHRLHQYGGQVHDRQRQEMLELYHVPTISSIEDIPNHYGIRIEVELPEQVFAIWSPGPSGIDMEGRVDYRQQHGGIPRRHTSDEGDIVIYPEGY